MYTLNSMVKTPAASALKHMKTLIDHTFIIQSPHVNVFTDSQEIVVPTFQVCFKYINCYMVIFQRKITDLYSCESLKNSKTYS